MGVHVGQGREFGLVDLMRLGYTGRGAEVAAAAVMVVTMAAAAVVVMVVLAAAVAGGFGRYRVKSARRDGTRSCCAWRLRCEPHT